jgi:hypothetical protein
VTTQARMTQSDPRLYNPSRDVAHNFDHVIMEVCDRIEKGHWDPLNKLAVDHGVSDEQLGLTTSALCHFVLGQLDRRESMGACLARSGFLDQPAMARVIVMAYLGQVVLGLHWAGVHESTLGGTGPLLDYADLRARGAECAKLMRMSKARRWWYKVTRRFRAAAGALKGGT